MNFDPQIHKILIAEDNPINQKLLMVNLQKYCVEADMAINGLEAVEMHEKNCYDIIFMDIQMPEMDGLEATTMIREMESKNPAQKRVQIIAMTANAMREDRAKCTLAGMDEYISKPFSINDIKRVLNL